MRYSILLIAFLSFTALGCGPRAKPVTLDVPVNHPVSVAPAQLEPGAGKVTAIDVPFGSGRYQYKAKMLEQPKSSEELERLADAMDAIYEQSRGLREDIGELQERLDFHERLLTKGKEDDGA